MNEHRRSLTPQEWREFEEIRARLSEEMPDMESRPADWERWRQRATFLGAFVGLGLLVVGLLITIVVIAFVGFVLLAFALWRISYSLRLDHWLARLRSMSNGSPPHDEDPSSEPR